ncbi:MAG: transketolase [Planctomyces sp.]|jgi:transketolase
MRSAFCSALMRHCHNPQFVFLTGDLGYGALEPLRDSMGQRFINAGVSEQNMVSVASGLAKSGFRPWAYSIAPFLYARPFEQIRNDVCLHRLPVVLVGNGGGYGYGVMGATHHALEDYGVLLTLPQMEVHVPAFDKDISSISDQLLQSERPGYLRLGIEEQPPSLSPPPYATWRKLLTGRGPVVLAVGPLAGGYWGAWSELPEEQRPCLWCLSKLPFGGFPEELWYDIRQASVLAVAEEHVAHGSAGSLVTGQLIEHRCMPPQYRHFTACGYPSERYGSQRFHRAECGLTPDLVLRSLTCP